MLYRSLALFFLPLCAFGLSIEEKIGQLLLCHFHGPTSNEEAFKLIHEAHVGGFIYYPWANELSSFEQVQELSLSLQKMNPQSLPLFLAIDQEGGCVSRLTKGFTLFPGQGALGVINDPSLTQQVAYSMAQEMHAAGINLNLSPVVDVNTNPKNPVIGIRSFGDSVATVVSLGKETLQGYRKAHILSCLKHFPGHGDTVTDSHESLPYVHKTKKELQQVELFPFAALAKEADCIMTAHIMMPALDPIYPATLSKDILNILRTRLQFQGLIIADSLVMEGVLQTVSSIEEASLKALLAGCDILLLGGRHLTSSQQELSPDDVIRIHKHLTKAVKDGVLSEKRLDESLARITRIKGSITPPSSLDPSTLLEHEKLAELVAKRAMKVVREPKFSPETSKNIVVLAPSFTKSSLEKLFPLYPAHTFTLFCFSSLSEEETAIALAAAEKADTLLFLSYNAWKYPSQQTLMNALSEKKIPLALIALSSPLDITLLPYTQGSFLTYSPSLPSIKAAFSYLLTK